MKSTEPTHQAIADAVLSIEDYEARKAYARELASYAMGLVVFLEGKGGAEVACRIADTAVRVAR